MVKVLVILLSFQITLANQQGKYLSARKQNILEYTTFGIDECLKLHVNKLTTNKAEKKKILIGSRRYFGLLSKCFQRIRSTCYGEQCIVSKSMSRRLENVEFIDSLLKKSL